MEVLPLRTHPPRTPTRQRHKPRRADWQGGYREYRSCLRWDFGFTCAFCLLHEADFSPEGESGLGVFTIEHLEPQSINKRERNEYTNLVYACRLCNRARSVAPRAVKGRRLLDPTKDAWAKHFQISGNSLVSQEEDVDASYTCEAYDFNDDRKVARREKRATFLSSYIRLVKEGPALREELLNLAEKHQEDSLTLLKQAQELAKAIQQARLNLESYSAIPADAPNKCRCDTTETHCLPDEFAGQILQIH